MRPAREKLRSRIANAAASRERKNSLVCAVREEIACSRIDRSLIGYASRRVALIASVWEIACCKQRADFNAYYTVSRARTWNIIRTQSSEKLLRRVFRCARRIFALRTAKDSLLRSRRSGIPLIIRECRQFRYRAHGRDLFVEIYATCITAINKSIDVEVIGDARSTRKIAIRGPWDVVRRRDAAHVFERAQISYHARQ